MEFRETSFCQLSKEGYENVDTVDGSAKMLEKAKERNVYKQLVCAFVGPDKMAFNEGICSSLYLV